MQTVHNVGGNDRYANINRRSKGGTDFCTVPITIIVSREIHCAKPDGYEVQLSLLSVLHSCNMDDYSAAIVVIRDD